MRTGTEIPHAREQVAGNKSPGASAGAARATDLSGPEPHLPPSEASATASAAAWADYFTRWPDELARVAEAAEREGIPARHPLGANTTAYQWARWLAARGFGGES